MFVCDICQIELKPGESFAVPMDDVRAIIYAGFSPIKCNIQVYENGVPTITYGQMVRMMAPDAGPEELEHIWKKTALERTRGGWALCPNCYKKAMSTFQ